jgi:O-antigen/teichoic acid export membrane protein
MSELPRRFKRSVTSSYLRTVTQAAVAIVMTPVLVHELGKTEYGIWVLVLSLALYLELFEFGLGTATVKYVAEGEAVGDREHTRASIATSFWMLVVPGLGAMLVGVAVALAFPMLFDIPEHSEGPARIAILLVAADLAISIPSDTFGNTLMAVQRYDVINVTLIVVLLAQAAGWAIVLAAGGGLVALAAVTVVLSLAGQLARFLIARRLLPGISISPRYFDRGRLRPLAGLSVWYALAETSTLVIARLDTVVVGLVVGVPEAAVYAVGQKLAFLAEQVIRPIVTTFFPHSSVLAARRDSAALRSTILTGTRVALAAAGPLAIALGLLAEPTLEVWVGPGFADAAVVVMFLAAAAAVSALARTGFLMLQGVGIARIPAAISGLEAALNLSLSVVLGQLMGLRGVALATLIAASVAQLGLLLPYVFRSFGLSPASFLGPILRAHVPAAAVALAVGWTITLAGPSGFVEVIAAGSAIVLAYLAALAVTGLSRDERRGALIALRGRSWRQAPRPQ